MQKILISLGILVFMLSGLSHADVFIITDKEGGLYTISEKDDTVIPEGYKKDIVKGKSLVQMDMLQSPDVYVYKSGKLSVDAKKISDKQKAEHDKIVADQDVKDKRKIAKDKLKSVGLTSDEIDLLVGKE